MLSNRADFTLMLGTALIVLRSSLTTVLGKLSNADISSCRVFGMHLTASVDQCVSVHKHGLLNLREVLQGDNPLGNSMRESGIRFTRNF